MRNNKCDVCEINEAQWWNDEIGGSVCDDCEQKINDEADARAAEFHKNAAEAKKAAEKENQE